MKIKIKNKTKPYSLYFAFKFTIKIKIKKIINQSFIHCILILSLFCMNVVIRPLRKDTPLQ